MWHTRRVGPELYGALNSLASATGMLFNQSFTSYGVNNTGQPHGDKGRSQAGNIPETKSLAAFQSQLGQVFWVDVGACGVHSSAAGPVTGLTEH